ncbi:MAG: DUF6305 family protein [Acidobacteriota bacterium]
MKKLLFLLSIIVLLSYPVMTETEAPQTQLPLLITSAGQSPDVTTLTIVAEEAGVAYDYCDVPTVELFKAGVGLADKESGPGFHVEINTDLDVYPKGTPYKTVAFAIGASLKGMGASGLTVESEVNRLKSLIDYCQENNIFILAVHIGGASKRGAPGSDNERMINAVAPYADAIIVTKDSNKDGRFDTIAQKNSIPLIQIDYALDLVNIFKEMFL